MNKQYYIADKTQVKGYCKLTESEYFTIVGEEPNKTYANQVYRGEITIDDVPEENRETVQAIVAAKIARWGEYVNQPISASELQKMIEGVM